MKRANALDHRGYPRAVRRALPLFFEVLPRLAQAGEGVSKRRTNSRRAEILRQMAWLSSLGFREMVLLAEHGFGLGAFRLLRSLFEYSINARYLAAYPEETKAFLNWHYVRQRRALAHMEKVGLEGKVKPEAARRAREGFERVRVAFLDRKQNLRGSWAREDLRRRAERVGREAIYDALYPVGSDLVHGTIGALAYLFRPTRRSVELIIPPSLDYCAFALSQGHKSTLDTLEAAIGALGRDSRPSFRKLERDYVHAWSDAPVGGTLFPPSGTRSKK